MATRPATIDQDVPEFAQQEAPTTELAIRRDVARVVQEVQGAIIVAKQFKRNEDEARVKLLRSCKRPGFAEEAEYEFPRGGNDISGPSVALAREAARVWGNVQYGFEIVAEDEVWRSIRAFAWDVETNTRPFQEDRFKKLIYRKSGGWVKPDERDLRELTNRRAAICYRNCILQILPKDLIDEAVSESRATLRNRAATDPDGERKRIADAFANDLNVMPNSLESILGHPLAEASPAEIVRLRGIYKSIRDGNSNLGDYLQTNGHADSRTANRSTVGLDAIKDRYAARTAQAFVTSSEGASPQSAAGSAPDPSAGQETEPSTSPQASPALSSQPMKEFNAQAETERILHHSRHRRGQTSAEPEVGSEPQGEPLNFGHGE